MLRLGSNIDHRRRLALPSSPSSSFVLSSGLVAGDINLSTIGMAGGMSSFGQRRYPEGDDEKDEKLPAPAAAAPPVNADDLSLPSPRRRALDSFEPLMSMASFDDHHFFVDEQHDESHNTMIPRGQAKHDDDDDDDDDDEAANDDCDDDDNIDSSTTRNTSSSSSRRRKTSSSSSSSSSTNRPHEDDDDNTSSTSSGLPMPMADPDDENNGFSPTMCLVRQQLEFFLADQADADARRRKGGVSGNVRAGSLGFRCIHCKHLPSTERAPSADAYPNQVQLIYQAVRNFQRHHFLKCPSVPQRLKDQYQSMPRRHKSKRPVRKHTNPWLYSAKRKGLSDVEDDTSKGGYRIAYNSPTSDVAVASSTTSTSTSTATTSTSTSAAATEASSSAPSSLSSTFAAASSVYYGRPTYQHHEHASTIGGLPPTPIQVKEPKRKKSRRS